MNVETGKVLLLAVLENLSSFDITLQLQQESQNITGAHDDFNVGLVVSPATESCSVLIKHLCIVSHKL